jgi:hypothetical protein
MRQKVMRWRILPIVIVVGCLVIAATAYVTTRAESKAAGLTYDMGADTPANPWIAEACRWPSGDSAPRTPPANAREQFAEWVQGVVAQEWLPGGSPKEVPYLEAWGFVSVKEANGYRVRVREGSKPAYEGSGIKTKAILMAAEPLTGDIPLPDTEEAMSALLGRFLGPAVPVSTADDQAQPHFQRTSLARFLARWPGSGDLPVQLYAWTDGKVLLVAAYEDVQYGSGPTPPPQVQPTSPPLHTEPIHISNSISDEDLAHEVSPEGLKDE